MHQLFFGVITLIFIAIIVTAVVITIFYFVSIIKLFSSQSMSLTFFLILLPAALWYLVASSG